MPAAEVAELVALTTAAAATSVVVPKTGRVAGAVCGDGKLYLWSLPDGRLLRTIGLGGRSIDAISISGDGRLIAGGDHDGGYTVWDVAAGSVRTEWKTPFYPFAMTFSPDARSIAIASVNQPVQIYDTGSHKMLLELQHPVGGSTAVVFSRDGGRIATADADTVVRVYNAHNGELLARNADFLLIPLALVFTADGKQLLAGGGDKVIARLDAATGSVIHNSEKAVDPVASMDISPDGGLAAAVLMHADNMLKPGPMLISEVASGRKVQEWTPETVVLGSVWSRESGLLAATATEKTVHVWRVR